MELVSKQFFVSRDVVFRESEFPFASTPLAECPLVLDLSMQAFQDLQLDPICISRDTTNNDLLEDHTLATDSPTEHVEETNSHGEEAMPEESLHDQYAILTESLQDQQSQATTVPASNIPLRKSTREFKEPI